MPPTNTLTRKQRVLQSGSWTLVAYGASQALRFAGNLILTRLLFPEVFGLMAITQAVLYGVHMLTDVGVGTSIVQNRRGSDQAFLDTAWTVQIIRGFLVWLGLCALAIPISSLYGEPLLALILPVAGLTAAIGGFNSTKPYAAQRNLEMARVAQVGVVANALGLLCTIYLAWLLQSVWALVWGNVFGVSLELLFSYVAFHGANNWFAWDREALEHLRGFGRWILLSSGLTFLSVEGTRLLIGAMLDMRQLALFTLASTMSLVLWQVMQHISGRVFLPAYAEVHRENPKNLATVLYKARLAMILPSWSLAVFFVFFGIQFMDALYDTRYHGSGVMLQTLAIGSLVACVWGSYSSVLPATGKVGAMAALTAVQIASLIAGIYVGYHYWGGRGIVMGVAAANWFLYPVNAYVMFRNGLWQPKLDVILIAASAVIVMVAWPQLTER